MSWQAYVDDHLLGSGHVTRAAILGRQGGVWAISAGYDIKQQEQDAITKKLFTDPSSAFTNGIHVGGERYVAVRANEDEVVGRKGDKGIFIMQTKQAIVIGEYDPPIANPQCSIAVAKVADYLKDAGY